ncbi:MAG: phosphatase PAP2 family protein [Anaerolineae bacterium]|nr:phosphatase PAP2 family protein [Anaerolineae bacterium]
MNGTSKYLFRNRLVLFVILLIIQFQFFTTNMINSLLRDPTDGWEIKIGFIDNNLSPNGFWLIPYAAGFVLSALLPLWAAYHMPNKLYRQYVVSMGLAAVFSYVIYMTLPTYVVKPAAAEISGNNIFTQLLRNSYKLDAAASTHNAAPSQHVFYAVINMCFMIRFRSQPRVFWGWVTLAALISASALLTMRHNSPDLIAGYLMAVFAYYAGLHLGARFTAWLGDEHDPMIAPPWPDWLPRRSRWSRRDVSTDLT